MEAALLGAYQGEPFVQLVDGVRTQSLRGSNLCQMQAWVDPERSRVIVAAAIDNLVKGAAGQAVAELIAGGAELHVTAQNLIEFRRRGV